MHVNRCLFRDNKDNRFEIILKREKLGKIVVRNYDFFQTKYITLNEKTKKNFFVQNLFVQNEFFILIFIRQTEFFSNIPK